jgi:ABC-type branched-subunit amino acid transport system ATPase component
VRDALVVEAADLRKAYGGVEAVRGLDLAVPAGSIFGFLGRNGAGKTTTIKVLLGMARPSGGRVSVFGQPADSPAASVDIRRRTGFVSEDKDLYDYMDVDGMIRMTAAFYPRWRADLAQRYLGVFELPPDRKVKALSRGMRTKLALLLALCRGAELLILDEPTSGLDPAMTEEVLQALVTHVASEEMTVSSRRTRSPKSTRSPTASRSSIAAARWWPARSTTCARRSGASSSCSTAMHRMRRFARPASCACGARAVSSRCCRTPAPRRCSPRRGRSVRYRSKCCRSR